MALLIASLLANTVRSPQIKKRERSHLLVHSSSPREGLHVPPEHAHGAPIAGDVGPHHRGHCGALSVGGHHEVLEASLPDPLLEVGRAVTPGAEGLESCDETRIMLDLGGVACDVAVASPHLAGPT